MTLLAADTDSVVFDDLNARLAQRTSTIGVIGLGYVGLPLAAAIARAGFQTIGFDIDPAKHEQIAAGKSYIAAVCDEVLS
jgi:UDP-N-acetyl-D-glucosamine dehydrogenase